MEKYIAILRGINVGGKRIIKMADLKTMCEQIGYKEVSTYIQSGNIIFNNATTLLEPQISEELSNSIKKTFGFEVPIVVFKAESLNKAIENNPFYNKDADVNKLHLTFLDQTPDNSKISQIQDLDFSPDKFVVIGKHAFIYSDNKYHKTKLSNSFFEQRLDITASTRNWKTVLKLQELAG